MTEESLFLAALDRKDPEERRRFLDEACAADGDLRKRIDVLLGAYAAGQGRLEPPTVAAPTADFHAGADVGLIIAGRYKLLERIGEGGMGEVWVARQTEPVQRKVALKLIKPGMDSKSVLVRFEVERQALAMMDHPNIAKVLDGGLAADGRPFFVMELVNGQPLTKFCDEAKLTPRQRLELFVPVCQAIQHAHQKGIVHRDLKPSNILVTLYDGRPVPKVIDFGVAKATGGRLTDQPVSTQFGAVVGTFEYMAPEQAGFSALDVDTRADIYSLGVILYELLTGLRPFDGPRLRKAAIDELFRILREEDPPKPSTKLSTDASLSSAAAVRGTDPKRLTALMKGELDWIVMRCLEKDRTRRYETANGLARDVQRYLADEVVEARPPSAGYRMKKFVRRNKGRVVAAGLVALALVGGVVGTTAGMVRAERSERSADSARAEALADRDAAVAARKQSFQALTDLTDSAVEERLIRKADLSPTERGFLERVIARYDALAVNLPAEAEAMRAECLSRVGRTYFHLGDFERSLAALRRADAMFRRLRDAAPGDPVLWNDQIESMNGVSACLSRLGRSIESHRAGEEAIALAEQGRTAFPDDHAIALNLAQLLDNRARGRDLHVPAAVAADVDLAVALAEAALRGGAPPDRAAITLAHALETRANRAGDAGDVEAVRTDLARLVALLDADRSSGKPAELTRVQANCLRSLANALLRTNQRDAGLAALRDSVARLEGLRAEYPGLADVGIDLTSAYRELEAACRDAGRAAEADDALRRATELSARAAADAESVVNLGRFIDLTAALARGDFKNGRPRDARANVERSVEAGRKLAARAGPPSPTEHPDRNRALRQQAHQFRQIADLAGQAGRPKDAAEFYTKLLEFARAAAPAGAGQDPEVFTLVESAHWGLSIVLDRTGRPADALVHWAELLRLSAWDYPGSYNEPACRHLAAKAKELAAKGQTADAVAVLAPGFAARHARLEAQPTSAPIRIDLRRGYRVLGLVLEHQQTYDDAVAAYDRALAVGPVPETAAEVASPAERELLSVTLEGRIACLESLGRTAPADAAWATFRKFAAAGEYAPAVWRHLTQLARRGKPARAVELAERHLAGGLKSGPDLYNAACVHAVAAADRGLPAERKEKFLGRAVALLRECEATGFLQDPTERANFHKDPDLKLVRGRPDFQQAFPEAKAPAKK